MLYRYISYNKQVSNTYLNIYVGKCLFNTLGRKTYFKNKIKTLPISQSLQDVYVICNIVRMLFRFCFPFNVTKSKTPKQQDGFLLIKTEGGDLIIMGQIWVVFTQLFFTLLVEKTVKWFFWYNTNVMSHSWSLY